MRTLTLLVVLTTLSQFCVAEGQPSSSAEKYCGSGFTQPFIPDSLLGCAFSQACQAHDTCYARCDPGGDLFGSTYCAKSEFSIERLSSKVRCDRTFYAAIDKQNDGRMVCRSVAAIYTYAVFIAGQGPFNGIPPKPDVIAKIVLSSKTSEEAVEKFAMLTKLQQQGKIDWSKLELGKEKLLVPVLEPWKSPVVKNGLLVLPNGISVPNIKNIDKVQK